MATKTYDILNDEKYNRSSGREDPAVRHFWRLQELAKEQNAPDVVQKEIDTALELVEAREQYGQNMSSPLSNDLSNILEDTFAHPWQKLFDGGKTSYRVRPYMISGNIEAQFLQFLVQMSNAKRVLELGLFTGFGALAMAEVLPDDGEVFSCEIEPYVEELARSFLDKSPHGKKVKIKGPAPAMETLQEIAENGTQFDLIFLDADKAGYIPYYKIIMEKNILAPGGTIVVDNVYAYGYPYCQDGMHDGQSVKDFNQMIKDDDTVRQVLLPIRDGVTLIRRK